MIPSRARSTDGGRWTSRQPWRVLVVLTVMLLAAPAAAVAKHYSPWGPAAEYGAPTNSGAADGCPIESPNGLELYFASNRDPVGPPLTDTNDIYVAQRTSKDADWSNPVRLPDPVNSTAPDFCPTPLNGGWLLFVSARGGGCGAGDMYITRNHPTRGWETPVNLGCHPVGPNSGGGEFSPSLVETDGGVLLYYSKPGASGTTGQDIHVSVMRADGTFGPGEAVTALNTSANDQMPNVSRDGLEIVFASDRFAAAGAFDVYTARRTSTSAGWSELEKLGPEVNSGLPETRPSLSGDGERLHFGRAGQIFVSTRVKITRSD